MRSVELVSVDGLPNGFAAAVRRLGVVMGHRTSLRATRRPASGLGRGLVVLVAGAAIACGGGGGSGGGGGHGADRPLTPEGLADEVGCTDIAELDHMIAPIRGRAATRGISCTVDGETVHVFARAPLGDPSTASYAAEQGGSLENIHRLVGVDVTPPACDVHLLVADDLFLLGGSEELLEQIGESADLQIEPVVRASPTVSYLGDCRL